MAVKKSENDKLFERYVSKMKTLITNKDASEKLSSIKKGQNSYMRIDRVESSSFDLSWINKIEDCLFELGDIITNPRENTKSVAHLVPVELARKTNAESIRHLASHTQYIKSIDAKNNVIPSKILSIANEEDLHTYENRFIATLIRLLVLFIEKRYEIVKDFAQLHDEEILYFSSKAVIGGEEVEMETKIKVRSISESQEAIKSNSYVSRIEKIREYVLFYYNSPFMKIMKTDRNVRSPIIMTNILRKNPKYHKCYELYRFIERYNSLGVGYKVNEDIFNYSTAELEKINYVILSNYLALKSKNKKNIIKTKNKSYKPKILTSLDDEEFIYGDLLKGPFEFVRVDADYLKYLEEKKKKDIPVRPTKVEKEYYAKDIEEKKEVKEDRAEKEKLLKRKEKEARDFDKKAKAMREKVLKEEAEKERKRLEEIRKAELARIEEERKNLVSTAKDNASEIKKEQKALEQEAKKALEEENNAAEVLSNEETPVVDKEVETPVDTTPVEESPKVETPVAEEVLNENKEGGNE